MTWYLPLSKRCTWLPGTRAWMGPHVLRIIPPFDASCNLSFHQQYIFILANHSLFRLLRIYQRTRYTILVSLLFILSFNLSFRASWITLMKNWRFISESTWLLPSRDLSIQISRQAGILPDWSFDSSFDLIKQLAEDPSAFPFRFFLGTPLTASSVDSRNNIRNYLLTQIFLLSSARIVSARIVSARTRELAWNPIVSQHHGNACGGAWVGEIKHIVPRAGLTFGSQLLQPIPAQVIKVLNGSLTPAKMSRTGSDASIGRIRKDTMYVKSSVPVQSNPP